MRMTLLLLLALFAPGVSAEEGPGEGGPGYRVVFRVVEPNGMQTERDGPHVVDTYTEAVNLAITLQKEGFCVAVTGPATDPDLVGLCWPPSRILRTRILLVSLGVHGEPLPDDPERRAGAVRGNQP